MFKALLTLLKRPDPPNAHLWHKAPQPLFYVRLENGKLSGQGQLWRRKVNGRWVYKQDEETTEAYLDRQY